MDNIINNLNRLNIVLFLKLMNLYTVIPITLHVILINQLHIIPFKDILARGMVASGATPPKRFI